MTEEQAKALKKLASKLGISFAELMRRAVHATLKSSVEISPEEKKRRAIAAAGRFHSGKEDISTKHDEYLDEALR